MLTKALPALGGGGVIHSFSVRFLHAVLEQRVTHEGDLSIQRDSVVFILNQSVLCDITISSLLSVLLMEAVFASVSFGILL